MKDDVIEGRKQQQQDERGTPDLTRETNPMSLYDLDDPLIVPEPIEVTQPPSSFDVGGDIQAATEMRTGLHHLSEFTAQDIEYTGIPVRGRDYIVKVTDQQAGLARHLPGFEVVHLRDQSVGVDLGQFYPSFEDVIETIGYLSLPEEPLSVIENLIVGKICDVMKFDDTDTISEILEKGYLPQCIRQTGRLQRAGYRPLQILTPVIDTNQVAEREH
jgi:hypothetical protein